MPSRAALPRPAILAGAAMVLLATAGCGSHTQPPVETQTATISFAGLGNADAGGSAGMSAQTVSVAVPGFSAKLNVPGLNLGGADTNIGGIPLHPGSKLTAMTIVGNAGDGSGGESHGTVDMRFTDAAAPDAVMAYYKQAAARQGWTEVPPAAGQQFAATKQKDGGSAHLAMQVGAAGAGTTGRVTITGG